jgi:hypothetical protein
MNEFAEEVGRHCADHLYLMHDAVGYIAYNPQWQRMSFVRLSPQSFISAVEKHIQPIKRKNVPLVGTIEVPHSMNAETAAAVMVSIQFRE